MKKSLLTSSIFLLISLMSYGQNWIPQNTGLGNIIHMAPFKTAIVDENTFWATPSSPAVGVFDPTPPLIVHTSDGGASWKVDNLPTTTPDDFQVVTLDAISADSAWIITFDNLSSIEDWVVNVIATFDGGDTWSVQDVFLTDVTIYPSQIHFFNAREGLIFASSVDGYFQAFRTTDAGANWVRLPAENFPPALENEWDVDHGYYARGDEFWLGTTKGRILHSADKGLTWEAIDTPVNSIIYKITFSEALHGIARFTNSFNWNSKNLLHTSDGGITWQAVHPIGLKSHIFDLKGIPGEAGKFLCSSYLLSLNDVQLFYSEDNGNNWALIDNIHRPGRITLWDGESGWISELDPQTQAVDVYKQEGLVSGLIGPQNSAGSLLLFPNPAGRFLNIKLPESQPGAIEVSVFDIQGRIVCYQQASVGQPIDVKGLTPGVYSVEVRVGEQVYASRFLKQ